MNVQGNNPTYFPYLPVEKLPFGSVFYLSILFGNLYSYLA